MPDSFGEHGIILFIQRQQRIEIGAFEQRAKKFFFKCTLLMDAMRRSRARREEMNGRPLISPPQLSGKFECQKASQAVSKYRIISVCQVGQQLRYEGRLQLREIRDRGFLDSGCSAWWFNGDKLDSRIQ